MNISGGNPRTYPPGSRFPIKIVVMDREPTESDIFDFEVGTEWLARLSTRISWWKLSGKEGGKALWLRLGGTDETKLKLNVKEDTTPSATFTQVDADPATGGIYLQGDNNVQVFKSANEDHSVDISGTGSGGMGGIRAVEGDNMTRGDPDATGLFHIDGDGTLTATSVHVAGEDTLTVRATEAVLSTLTGDGNTEAQARSNKIAITGENGITVHAAQAGASGLPTLSIGASGGGGNPIPAGVSDDNDTKIYPDSHGIIKVRGEGDMQCRVDSGDPHRLNVTNSASGAVTPYTIWNLVNPTASPAEGEKKVRIGYYNFQSNNFTEIPYTLWNPSTVMNYSKFSYFAIGKLRIAELLIAFNMANLSSSVLDQTLMITDLFDDRYPMLGGLGSGNGCSNMYPVAHVQKVDGPDLFQIQYHRLDGSRQSADSIYFFPWRGTTVNQSTNFRVRDCLTYAGSKTVNGFMSCTLQCYLQGFFPSPANLTTY